MKYTVYEAYTRRVAFEGTADECRRWIGKQAAEQNYGIYRVWTVDGDTHYDVGPNVYIYNGPFNSKN